MLKMQPSYPCLNTHTHTHTDAVTVAKEIQNRTEHYFQSQHSIIAPHLTMSNFETERAMASLFGGQHGAGGGGAAGGSGYLHSFKAGRCDFDPTTKTVTPQPAKGTLFIKVCWSVTANTFRTSSLATDSLQAPEWCSI